ncbi:MAG: pyrroline-5-carboxylate reductase [Cyanobacteria bacterium SIG29]|nr:pyrroline-5-carboxylate reductase [Cyanobacteria bacterium SIG29]
MNKIGFIGGGKMATAIIKGIINSNWCSCENIFVSDKNTEALEVLKKEYKVSTTQNNFEVIKNANIILFAVKPFILKDVLNEIKPFLTDKHIIFSIAAGVSINSIEEIVENLPVIRIMPNTPALVNEGMSAICKGTFANDEHAQIALDIFNNVGKVIKADEKYIDIITAISGSGPAFYYYVINEIAKAGEKLGLDYETCLKLSAQTALGSAKMIMETNVSPEQLIINVTTPGGCTAVGNDVLKENNTSDILFDTIKNTAQKAHELGKN